VRASSANPLAADGASSALRQRSNIGTVVAAAFLTFLGFLGIPKIVSLVSACCSVSNDGAEFTYNMVVFLVLLFTILNVAFQLKEKAFQRWRAINLLTDFITDIDGILAVSKIAQTEVERKMSFINSRYKHVVDILPPSTDGDYIKARRAMAYKESLKVAARSPVGASV
jgi:hypothetical protein